MNNIPAHLRAKIRGDALKAINSRAFLTPYDAFMMGVEYVLENPDLIHLNCPMDQPQKVKIYEEKKDK